MNYLAFKFSDIVFIMLVNVKNASNCWHLSNYEHDILYAQLSCACTNFITSGPVPLKLCDLSPVCLQIRTSDTLIGYLPIFQMLPKTSLCIRYHWYPFNRMLDVLGTN